MALQTGIGLSRILILAGAVYTVPIFVKNGKFSELLGELQSLIKGYENSGDQADPDSGKIIADQVHRLAMEMRNIRPREITVLTGGSGQGITSLVVPATALGALGYGYMWWKGLSFSDLMYVTKRSMTTAVTNLTDHLKQVSELVNTTKRHLTQRIENLDGKMDDQKELSKLIRNEVNGVCDDLTNMKYDLGLLHKTISCLDGRIDSLEDKQDLSNAGVMYLVNVVNGKKVKMPEILKKELQLPGKPSCPKLTYFENSIQEGLKLIMDSTVSGTDVLGVIDKFGDPSNGSGEVDVQKKGKSFLL